MKPMTPLQKRAAFIQRALQLFAVTTMMNLTTTTHAAGWEKLPPLPEPNGGIACDGLGDSIVVTPAK